MSLTKLYERIIWANNTSPALNDTNLNAMSKGLDDIDNRVISLAGTIMETVPQVEQDLSDAEALVEQMQELTANPPYIGANGDWYVWDTQTNAYVDSGVDASITISIGQTTTLPAGSSATVTNSGTSTDPVFNFGIPQGAQGNPGTDGDDGVSPAVTITTITGGHAVTITDASHPGGQTFNVMDGTGDMSKSVYDPNNTVANAGGIVAYIDSEITAALTASY